MKDFRDIQRGLKIPSIDYCDQPMMVWAKDGALVVTITTSRGAEGADSTFVGIARSYDLGKTWTELKPVDQEPRSSYSSLFAAPSGRLFCFYGYTPIDNQPQIAPGGREIKLLRNDMGGYIFCFKISDDSGATWSEERYPIPMRDFEIDRRYAVTQGGREMRFFWNVSAPFVKDGGFYHPIIKVEVRDSNPLHASEGALLFSPNLLTEEDPRKIVWRTLPEGEIGLRAPGGEGIVAEEQDYVVQDDGSIFVVYRTVSGYMACARSADNGGHFSKPEYLTYADGGRVKHPRACPRLWKCRSGKYLLWTHNAGTKAWIDRNPAWVCAGVEKDGKILFGRPEILLYHKDAGKITSYPDLIERDGRYFLSETVKFEAFLHEIPAEFFEALWGRGKKPEPALTWTGGDAPEYRFERFFNYHNGVREEFNQGYTFVLTFDWDGEDAVLLSNRGALDEGIQIEVCGGRLKTTLGDMRSCSVYEGHLDLRRGKNTTALIVDGGPFILRYLVNGKDDDGGEAAPIGFGRFHPFTPDLNGNNKIQPGARVAEFALYDRALLACEVTGTPF